MPEENRFDGASVRRTDLARLNGRPSGRQQLGNFTRTLGRQACKNILQVSIRIMPVEPRGLDQTLDRHFLHSGPGSHQQYMLLKRLYHPI